MKGMSGAYQAHTVRTMMLSVRKWYWNVINGLEISSRGLGVRLRQKEYINPINKSGAYVR